MHSVQPVANPFALLLNPEAVVAEMERSERLNRLSSRICRPLDRPHPAEAGEGKTADSNLVMRDSVDSQRFR
jgi:hypothetical protein